MANYVRIHNYSYVMDARDLLIYKHIEMFVSSTNVHEIPNILARKIPLLTSNKFIVRYDGPSPKEKDYHFFSLVESKELKNKDYKNLLGGDY